MENHWLLTLTILMPLVGMAAVLVVPRQWVRQTALAFAALTFLLSLLILPQFLGAPATVFGPAYQNGFKLVHRLPWIHSAGFSIDYMVGVDGIGFPLVLLTTLVCLLACVASWNIEKSPRGYFSLFLL